MESTSPANDTVSLSRRTAPTGPETIRKPVQALHIGSVAGQLGKPVPPIAPSMPVNILDLTLLFQGDGEQANRDNLLVGEVQVSIRRVAWACTQPPLANGDKPQGKV